jgi:hypothetical protein
MVALVERVCALLKSRTTPRTFRFSYSKTARRDHMKLIIKTVAALAVGCASLGYAFAAPDPAVADSPTPSIQYQSPFKDYRPLGNNKRSSWKAANDEVGKIGGWRVYLRESQEANKAAPEAASAVKAAPSAPVTAPAKSLAPDKPKPSEHAGHGQHK